MVFNHLANLFGNTSIVGAFTLVFHVCKAITVGTLMKVNTFVSGVVFEAPLTLLDLGFFVIPSIGEGIRGTLGLGLFFLRHFSRDIIDDGGSDMVISVGSPQSPCHFF